MDYIIIDVREPQEYSMGHIEGAINIPSESLMNNAPELDDLPKNTPLVVYCKTGSRSLIAMGIIKKLGFTDITNGINQTFAERFIHERS